jgi:hypothetical protein
MLHSVLELIFITACNATSPLVTMANDASAESFSISSTSLYVTLADELDYEVTKEYYLLLSVIDDGKPLTGYIAVRVNVYIYFYLV